MHRVTAYKVTSPARGLENKSQIDRIVTETMKEGWHWSFINMHVDNICKR